MIYEYESDVENREDTHRSDDVRYDRAHNTRVTLLRIRVFIHVRRILYNSLRVCLVNTRSHTGKKKKKSISTSNSSTRSYTNAAAHGSVRTHACSPNLPFSNKKKKKRKREPRRTGEPVANPTVGINIIIRRALTRSFLSVIDYPCMNKYVRVRSSFRWTTQTSFYKL